MGHNFRHYVLARPAGRVPDLHRLPVLLGRLAQERLMPPWTFYQVSTHGHAGPSFLRTLHLDLVRQQLEREGVEEVRIMQELDPRRDRLFEDTALPAEVRAWDEPVPVSLILHQDFEDLTGAAKDFARPLECAGCGADLALDFLGRRQDFYGRALRRACGECGAEVDVELFGSTGSSAIPQELNPGVVPAFRFGLVLDFGKACPWNDDFDEAPLANPLVQRVFREVLDLETVQFRWAEG